MITPSPSRVDNAVRADESADVAIVGRNDVIIRNMKARMRALDRRRPWLAARLGVPYATINAKWTGQRKWKVEELGPLADALGVSIAWLMDDESTLGR